MFITRLYKHSKFAAICFLLFIASYLFINYKWGVVATPIYQLGLYSGVAHIGDTQTVYTFYVDDKLLLLNNLPFAHADMIVVSLSRYKNHEANNKAVMDVFNKYSNKLFNQSLQIKPYTNAITDQQAGLWFHQLLRGYGIPNKKISVYSNRYIWVKHQLRPIAQEKLIHVFASDL